VLAPFEGFECSRDVLVQERRLDDIAHGGVTPRFEHGRLIRLVLVRRDRDQRTFGSVAAPGTPGASDKVDTC
jgi:hypothetical protein